MNLKRNWKKTSLLSECPHGFIKMTHKCKGLRYHKRKENEKLVEEVHFNEFKCLSR